MRCSARSPLSARTGARGCWRCLDEALDRHILEATLRDGPAVDGVSRLQAATIDNFDLGFHHQKLRMVRTLAEGGHAV